MIDVFVKRPATTIMLISVFVVMGMVSYFNLIQERTPKVEFPLVTVDLVYPGASSVEIESQMVKKVEDAVSEISDIKKLQSYVFDNFARIVIEFKLGVSVDVKSIEVKDKVEPLSNDFPANSEKPVIAKFDPLVTSVVDLVLMSDTHSAVELFEYADKELKDKLTVISGVASVDIAGGKERQINVFVDNNLLLRNFLTINDIIQAIGKENINIPGGSIDGKTKKTSLRFIGEFQDVEAIRNLNIPTKEGHIVKLSDIATVMDSFKRVETMAKFNGKDVVILPLMKLSDGSAVEIVEEIKSRLSGLQSQLPKGMSLEIGYDSTETIIEGNETTLKNIVIGIALTVFILLIFLGDWRTALISTIVVPSSMISSFLLMDFSSFTINMMTLLAFGTALGTLIANALVVIESIYAHLQKGKPPIDAAIDGTKEVLLSVFAASGTNLVVFTPIAFMGGIVGQFFVQFGLTVVFATLFSILASISLTPMLCGLLLRSKSEGSIKGIFPWIASKIDKVLAGFLRYYRQTFDFIVSRPIRSTVLFILIFFTVVYPIRYVGSEFFPSNDDNLIMVSVVMPDGTPIEKTNSVIKKIEDKVSTLPELESVISNLGGDGEEEAEIKINLVHKLTRDRSDTQIMAELLPFVSRIPEAVITISRPSTGGGQGDIDINVYGDDFEELNAVSTKLKNIMESTGYFSSIVSSYKTPKNEIKFIPDSKKMIQQGITNDYVGITLRNIVNGDDSYVYKEKGEEFDIMVELRDEQKENEEDFEKFGLWAKDGLVTIGSLGDIAVGKAIPPIKRRDKKRMIVLSGYLAKGTSGPVSRILDSEFKKIKYPEGMSYMFAGNAEMQEESNQEMGKAFLLAVILTFMLLVAILNSFVFPIAIGTTIITSYMGAFLMLFYFDVSISIASMMALVMLVGLTVNNAILIIEFALQKMSEGVEGINALWLGVESKFKTVVMTSLAIIMGAFPQFISTDVMAQGMGAVLIGGMLGSLFFTYTIVPPVFILIYKVRKRFVK